MSENVEKTPVSGLNPSALALADAARLLSKVGGQAVTAAMLQADIAAGAPVLRYGIAIGHALQRIAAGSWVHERLLKDARGA